MVVRCSTSGSCVAMVTQITRRWLLKKWPKAQCHYLMFSISLANSGSYLKQHVSWPPENGAIFSLKHDRQGGSNTDDRELRKSGGFLLCHKNILRFVVMPAVSMKSLSLLACKSVNSVDGFHRFERNCCPHFQGTILMSTAASLTNLSTDYSFRKYNNNACLYTQK